jgi:hypothetical protein
LPLTTSFTPPPLPITMRMRFLADHVLTSPERISPLNSCSPLSSRTLSQLERLALTWSSTDVRGAWATGSPFGEAVTAGGDGLGTTGRATWAMSRSGPPPLKTWTTP